MESAPMSGWVGTESIAIFVKEVAEAATSVILLLGWQSTSVCDQRTAVCASSRPLASERIKGMPWSLIGLDDSNSIYG